MALSWISNIEKWITKRPGQNQIVILNDGAMDEYFISKAGQKKTLFVFRAMDQMDGAIEEERSISLPLSVLRPLITVIEQRKLTTIVGIVIRFVYNKGRYSEIAIITPKERVVTAHELYEKKKKKGIFKNR